MFSNSIDDLLCQLAGVPKVFSRFSFFMVKFNHDSNLGDKNIGIEEFSEKKEGAK